MESGRAGHRAKGGSPRSCKNGVWNGGYPPAFKGSAQTRLYNTSVRKDSLGGKAGCDESRLSGLGGGSTKPTIRKESKARCFYPHTCVGPDST